METIRNRLIPRSAKREQGINVEPYHFQEERKSTFRDEKMELEFYLSERIIDDTSELFDSIISDEISEQ